MRGLATTPGYNCRGGSSVESLPTAKRSVFRLHRSDLASHDSYLCVWGGGGGGGGGGERMLHHAGYGLRCEKEREGGVTPCWLQIKM